MILNNCMMGAHFTLRGGGGANFWAGPGAESLMTCTIKF